MMRHEVVASLNDDFLHMTHWHLDLERRVEQAVKEAVADVSMHHREGEDSTVAHTLTDHVAERVFVGEAATELETAREFLVTENPCFITVPEHVRFLNQKASEIIGLHEGINETITWAINDADEQGYDENSKVRAALESVIEELDYDSAYDMLKISEKALEKVEAAQRKLEQKDRTKLRAKQNETGNVARV